MESRFDADFGDIRVHEDERAAKLADGMGARAFAYGKHLFFARGQYRPDSADGAELIAHELTHTIQQGAAPQHAAPAQPQAPRVQRANVLGFELSLSPLDWAAKQANLLPGFPLLTLILGLNPINGAQVDRSPANLIRAVITLMPGGALIVQALDRYGIIDKVGGWISGQIDTLKLAGAAIAGAFTAALKSIDLTDPSGSWERVKRIFTEPIDRIKQFIRGLADGVIQFVRDAVLRPLVGLAAKTKGWDLLIAVLGRNPITGEPVPQTADTLVGGFMKLIGQEEIWENIKKANATARVMAWYQKSKAELLNFVQQFPTLFLNTLKSFKIEDLLDLTAAFGRVAASFGDFAGRFFTWAGAAMWSILEIIFEVVSPAALGYIKKAGAAFKDILKNPLGFVGNLVKAAKLGLTNFADNLVEHLKAGLIDWLTGSLPGVYIPKALSLGELGKFALSVLGISWGQVRGKIVKALGAAGETIMKGLETTYDVVIALVNGGAAAVWELIKEKLTDLKDTVLQGIIGFVVDAVVKKAIPKLVAMFIPGAGFISAIISIYDTIMVFVEKLSKIAAAVKAFVDSIIAIAQGQIGGAAKKVESTLAGLLSLAISFLAGFAGLGKVADKIKEVIQKVWATVDKAVETAVGWIVGKAKALFGKLFGRAEEKGVPTRADLPRDPAQRLQVAVREIRPRVARLIARAEPESDLRTNLVAWRAEFDLRKLDLIENRIVAGNSPDVDVEAVLRSNAPQLRAALARAADQIMADPRVLAEQVRVGRGHRGPAGIATASARGVDTVIPTVAVGPGPGFLGAAGALREADRPARFGPRSPAEFTAMPFGTAVVSEQQSARGPGGVIVGRGREPGRGRVSVVYDALVARVRRIANSQSPALSDQRLASIITRYVNQGATTSPFDRGENAQVLAEFGRIAFSIEVARSSTFALESGMILSLLQTGHLTFEQAFERTSLVNPMTFRGASAATRVEEQVARGTATAPGGHLGQNVKEVTSRRTELLVKYALREIENRKLTFGSEQDVVTWAHSFLVSVIHERAQELFGLAERPPSSLMN